MRVLLDECLPEELMASVTQLGHTCGTARRAGFGAMKNGKLLASAEGQWDVLLTSDQHMKHQQNLAGRKISVVILRGKRNRLEDLEPLMDACGRALRSISPGEIVEIYPV
jgi:predicted nuclease of predicted toxin-antitoxin system